MTFAPQHQRQILLPFQRSHPGYSPARASLLRAGIVADCFDIVQSVGKCGAVAKEKATVRELHNEVQIIHQLLQGGGVPGRICPRQRDLDGITSIRHHVIFTFVRFDAVGTDKVHVT